MYNIVMLNVNDIVQAGGLLAIGLVIFAESGLLFGFIFPGDTLLLAAGFFAGQGKISIAWLIIVTVVAAIVGDNVGYRIGRKLGPRIFTRREGLLFRKEYVERTQAFYEKHGGITLIIARFIAYIRTFAPVIAGVGRMDWRRFALFNMIGGVLWGAGLPLLGYAIGYSFPEADRFFIWFLVISAHILLIIILFKILRDPATRKELRKRLMEEWRYFKKS